MRPETSDSPIRLRLASATDVPALNQLIEASATSLSVGLYSPEQIEGAIKYVFGVDTQLIADGTYWVAESGSALVGCGGWSRRAKLFGGDQMSEAADPLLDPNTDPARIRAFFVHPNWARRGIAASILERCFRDMQNAGFATVELAATLPGVPLYERFGFHEIERIDSTLPNGVGIPFVRMSRSLAQ